MQLTVGSALPQERHPEPCKCKFQLSPNKEEGGCVCILFFEILTVDVMGPAV